MLARSFLLPLMASLVLAIAGCGGQREVALETLHLDLSGYAYTGDLTHSGDARLQMDLTVTELYRGRDEQPLKHLMGSGTLTIAEQVYTVGFGPSPGPFLSNSPRPGSTCYEYYLGGAQAAFDGEVRLDLNLEISEDFRHAKGTLAFAKSGEITHRGASSICFDEEGKRGFEIFRVEFERADHEGVPIAVNSRALVLNLGPDISPLDKLQEHRAKFPDER